MTSSYEAPTGPDKLWSCDVATFSGSTDPKHALVFKDLFSKSIHVVPIFDLSHDTVLDGILLQFNKTGLPERIRTDSAFKSRAMITELAKRGCVLETSSAVNSNAMPSERAIRSVRLIASRLDGEWHTAKNIYAIHIALNHTKNSIGFKPVDILHGYKTDFDRLMAIQRPVFEAKTPQIDITYDEVVQRIVQQPGYHNSPELLEKHRKRVNENYKVGDRVRFRLHGSSDTKMATGVITMVEPHSINIRYKGQILSRAIKHVYRN